MSNPDFVVGKRVKIVDAFNPNNIGLTGTIREVLLEKMSDYFPKAPNASQKYINLYKLNFDDPDNPYAKLDLDTEYFAFHLELLQEGGRKFKSTKSHSNRKRGGSRKKKKTKK